MSRTKDKDKAEERLAKRIARWEIANAKGGKGGTHIHRPGSRNGHK